MFCLQGVAHITSILWHPTKWKEDACTSAAPVLPALASLRRYEKRRRAANCCLDDSALIVGHQIFEKLSAIWLEEERFADADSDLKMSVARQL